MYPIRKYTKGGKLPIWQNKLLTFRAKVFHQSRVKVSNLDTFNTLIYIAYIHVYIITFLKCVF